MEIIGCLGAGAGAGPGWAALCSGQPPPTSLLGPLMARLLCPSLQWLGQLLSVLFLISWLLVPLLLLLFCILFPPLCLLGVPYLAWIAYDTQVWHRNGRPSRFVKGLRVWKLLRDYFPQKLVKTAELPPTHNYMFCLFPHGLLTSFAAAHFFNDTSDIYKHFPGLTLTGHTLNINFMVPVFRDILLSLGLVSVGQSTLEYRLTQPPGNSVFIVPGGSAEAAKSEFNHYRLVLKDRKGFIRIALTTGASLVPVFGFGENEVFRVVHWPESSFIHRLQERFRQATGVAPVLFYGRGLFQPWFGLLPFRVPVTTVVGAPIHVARVPNPTQQQIDELHQTFCRELTHLFHHHKHKYLRRPHKAKLTIE